jgi:hypothetical protein
LDEHSFLAKNQKLAPKWSGPHKILRLKGDCNVKILLRHNNKKLITHVNRLKPYFVQSPSAISSPDFFPAQKDATPPPVAQRNDAQTEDFYPYDDEILEEVIHTDPSPPTRITQTSQRRRATSSSSSVYDYQEVTSSDPSPSRQPTYADVVHRPRQRLASSSSTRSSLPPDGVASRTRSCTGSLTLERPKLYMLQITFDPLPVL